MKRLAEAGQECLDEYLMCSVGMYGTVDSSWSAVVRLSTVRGSILRFCAVHVHVCGLFDRSQVCLVTSWHSLVGGGAASVGRAAPPLEQVDAAAAAVVVAST
jgi:hypothetical protein